MPACRRVRERAADRRCSAARRRSDQLVAPGEAPAFESAARGALPLRLGRQALARPFAVRLRVVPRHVDDRMAGPVAHVRARPLRALPRRVLDRHATTAGRRRRGAASARRAAAGEDERAADALGVGDVARSRGRRRRTRRSSPSSRRSRTPQRDVAHRALAVARDGVGAVVAHREVPAGIGQPLKRRRSRAAAASRPSFDAGGAAARCAPGVPVGAQHAT